MIQQSEDFVALSPGAKDTVRKLFGVTRKLTASKELEMTKTLTILMAPGRLVCLRHPRHQTEWSFVKQITGPSIKY